MGIQVPHWIRHELIFIHEVAEYKYIEKMYCINNSMSREASSHFSVPIFHGAWRSISVFIRVCHWTLSWFRKSVQAQCWVTGLHPTPSWRATLLQLSTTTYSLYSQLPTIYGAIFSICNLRTLPWWHGIQMAVHI